MSFKTSLTALILCLVLATNALADLIITVGSTVINPTQSTTGFVDVFIRSTTGADQIDSFGVEFQIMANQATQLAFSVIQPTTQLTASTYIFFGDSFDQINGLPVFGPPTATVYPNDTVVGGDNTNSGLPVTVPTTDELLATLQFTTQTGIPPDLGDTFTVSLIAGINTSFTNAGVPVPFTSTSGTVLVDIPEPTSIALWGAGSSILWLIRRRGRVW